MPARKLKIFTNPSGTRNNSVIKRNFTSNFVDLMQLIL